MSDFKAAEARCPVCNRDTLLLRKPKYDGFTKVGEEVSCAACGHIFADASVAAPASKKPSIFGEDDLPKKINLFQADEAGKLCGHCRSYTINPFRQWCARHQRDVEATDTCADFTPKPPEKLAPPAEKPKNILLALLFTLAFFQ